MQEFDMPKNGLESVIDAMAEARAAPKPPMTVADAIERARYMRKVPEIILDDRNAKLLIDTLLSAIEASPCYMKAVRDGIPSFTLLAYDKSAHDALVEWINSATDHGCRKEKIDDATRQLSAWMMRDDLRWPT